MTRTAKDVIKEWRIIQSGRTRYEGQERRDDELILTHIDALRAALKECADELAEYMDFEHAIRDRYAIVNDKYERIAAAVRRARELLGDKP